MTDPMNHVRLALTLERFPEFGVRMALGASSRRLLANVLGRAARLTAIGAIIGLFIATAAARAVHTMLFGLNATDVLTSASVLLAVTPLVILAAALPAWRASRVDPLRALRAD